MISSTEWSTGPCNSAFVREPEFPEFYKDFRLYRSLGRVYGFPPFLEADETLHDLKLLRHPATLTAPTLEEMQALIDNFDFSRYEPELLESYEGYDLVRHCGSLYGVPQSAGPVNLNLDDVASGPALSAATG